MLITKKRQVEPITDIYTRTWLPEDTKVRLNADWISIINLKHLGKLIVFDFKENAFISGSILEYNRMYYSGYIKRSKGIDYEYEGLILLPENKIKRVDHWIEPNDETDIYYEGWLYNIVTTSDNLITRKSNNNDYIITLCQTAE